MSTVFKDKLSTVLPDMIYIIWGRLVILPGTIMVSLYYYYGTYIRWQLSFFYIIFSKVGSYRL